ncbi:molybdenum cofactor guanylyltransferase [Dyadobacter sandarakinus]|uniref:Probable molybdenum cofactor guanylyltransferase n=1 Tax=Dyadobacter sandarakinus TaxID=2747268 RepID=A0ABX7ICG6_9BACT|nr:molybdenum cofactor guanylyltransferase [Dyadobacter sandarakinus]QRR03806.1 molybdenum cofactor guanylyltransferase [Dyadobacter sandarakinus]
MRKPIGIVVCGGLSTRMGTDKSLLVYHQKPQRYHLYDLLAPICSEVWLSCNPMQAPSVLPGFRVITDAPEFAGNGPIAALLSARKMLGTGDFLLVGCDYPFISEASLTGFLHHIDPGSIAAVHFNREGWYEPLLGWYSAASIPLLESSFHQGKTSLQSFLKNYKTQQYTPQSELTMTSVDTPQEYEHARMLLQQNSEL